MLPLIAFNMEGCSNSSSFNSIYDVNNVLNCVRNRKKVSELPNCPVCSCTIRQGELESHLALEVERLQKITSGSKRKLSTNSSNMPVAGSSTFYEEESNEDVEMDVSGCPGSDVYQRIHSNRLNRLRSRRRSPPRTGQGECPVCNATRPVSRLHRHTLRCLKRSGAELDEPVPDSSSEEGSIDVENDEPSGFGAEYQWCGEWRVRATALQDADSRPGTSVRRASTDHALVVDDDEDTALYGPPQYSPSRIAPDADTSKSSENESESNGIELQIEKKTNGLVEASAETRIQALKMKIKELEKKQNSGLEAKCLICLGPYTSPAVSIQCWHVYCEVCWLESLKAKKICPQCNAITTAGHLRRIYM
ncbi:unnamed protein product [Pieris macdunnoughi]|uniref:RING-type domain-containing protein n=2 Tax=Pieris macdunnoughi TaxID=345717 RepID=A0A821XSE1_9NEOP|nr:unnamed protein product [Pieris macdunnoughi]